MLFLMCWTNSFLKHFIRIWMSAKGCFLLRVEIVNILGTGRMVGVLKQMGTVKYVVACYQAQQLNSSTLGIILISTVTLTVVSQKEQ